jgi:hypothetical protein
MATPVEIARIHDAMTLAKGVRPTAAFALGWTVEDLNSTIASCKELTTLWSRATEAPTIEEAYDRNKPAPLTPLEPVDLGLSPREVAVSSAFMSQEIKLQKFDWDGIGISDPKTQTLMRQFEAGVGRGVLRMMDAMQGGMAFCFAKVSRQFADVAEELEAQTALDDDDPAKDQTKIMMLHQRFMDLAKEMQKFNKEATAAAHTRLLIADRARKIQQAGNRMRKPGWRRVDQTKDAK